MAIKKYTNGLWAPASYRKYGTETDTITTLPATIIGDGTPISSYTIKGNMEQSGTPTPENPIMPEGAGERTENLWNFSASTKGLLQNGGTVDTNANYSTSDYIPVTAGQSYTFRALSRYAQGRYVRAAWYDSDKQFVDYSSVVKEAAVGSVYTNSYTAPNNASYARVSGFSYLDSEFMFVEGSTALPYEPYGYKLPLTLGSTTTNIYLGEVQTTRRIKKLVLTGEEDWSIEGADNFYMSVVIAGAMIGTTVVCSHQVSIQDSYTPGVENVWISMAGRLNFTTTAVSHTIADFKAFLAQQYANGTPVTVWYVLAEPTTGILNEPLRKIGDYVDSVSGTGLATSGAVQEFDVGTTLKPSEVDMTYHGWHEHDDTKYSM